MKLDSNSKIAIGISAAIVILGYMAGKAVAEGAHDGAVTLGQALNPTSDKNIFYRGTNELLRVFTGDKNDTLGTKIYDWFNPEQNKLLSDALRAKGRG